MAGRQRATFQKRQKEAKRQEKQRLKAEKRAARKAEKARGHLATDSPELLAAQDMADEQAGLEETE